MSKHLIRKLFKLRIELKYMSLGMDIYKSEMDWMQVWVNRWLERGTDGWMEGWMMDCLFRLEECMNV